MSKGAGAGEQRSASMAAQPAPASGMQQCNAAAGEPPGPRLACPLSMPSWMTPSEVSSNSSGRRPGGQGRRRERSLHSAPPPQQAGRMRGGAPRTNVPARPAPEPPPSVPLSSSSPHLTDTWCQKHPPGTRRPPAPGTRPSCPAAPARGSSRAVWQRRLDVRMPHGSSVPRQLAGGAGAPPYLPRRTPALDPNWHLCGPHGLCNTPGPPASHPARLSKAVQGVGEVKRQVVPHARLAAVTHRFHDGRKAWGGGGAQEAARWRKPNSSGGLRVWRGRRGGAGPQPGIPTLAQRLPNQAPCTAKHPPAHPPAASWMAAMRASRCAASQAATCSALARVSTRRGRPSASGARST